MVKSHNHPVESVQLKSFSFFVEWYTAAQLLDFLVRMLEHVQRRQHSGGARLNLLFSKPKQPHI